MRTLPSATLQLIRYLSDQGIVPILYGSQGVSLYLGTFKNFGDIDLLVEDRFLRDKWPFLQDSMKELGYKLIDVHEHEFINRDNQLVAFASQQILLRDGILKDLDTTVEIEVGNTKLKTLSVNDFIRAYEFSKKDGYRKNNRGKNDQTIINLLKSYSA